MEKSLVIQAREMHRAGKSIRLIAALLGTSKSNVHRWITGNFDTKAPVEKIELSQDVPNGTGQNGTVVPKKRILNKYLNDMENEKPRDEKIDKDIILKKIENEHKLALRKEDREDNELELKREQLRIEKLKLNSIRDTRMKEEKAIHWDMMQFFRKENEEIEDSENSIVLTLEELDDKINLLQKLTDRLEKYCFDYDLEAETLLYYSMLKRLLRLFKNVYKINLEKAEENEPMAAYVYSDELISKIRLLTRAEFEEDE